MHLRFANRRVSRCNRCWQNMGGIFPVPGLAEVVTIHDGFMHSLRYSCFSPIYAADLQIAIMGITTWHNVAQRKKTNSFSTMLTMLTMLDAHMSLLFVQGLARENVNRILYSCVLCFTQQGCIYHFTFLQAWRRTGFSLFQNTFRRNQTGSA